MPKGVSRGLEKEAVRTRLSWRGGLTRQPPSDGWKTSLSQPPDERSEFHEIELQA